MNNSECNPEENIVRAIRISHWDPKNGRLSSDLFRGPKTSVGRLLILPLKNLFKIFHSELDRPYKLPPDMVQRAGEIKIELLKYLGANWQPKPTGITVELKPTPKNPAHAEILQRLSKGLCYKINDSLEIHEDPYLNGKLRFLYFSSFWIKHLIYKAYIRILACLHPTP